MFPQAVRNLDDLECLACPPKYRELKSFYKYYTGQLKAPYLTVFSAPRTDRRSPCNGPFGQYYVPIDAASSAWITMASCSLCLCTGGWLTWGASVTHHPTAAAIATCCVRVSDPATMAVCPN